MVSLKKILFFRSFITKGNLKIVALCFLTASGFWLVKKLNKKYNTKMRVPIAFHFNHQKVYTRNKIPTSVWVDAQSTGWRLLQHRFGLRNDTLTFNIVNFFDNNLIVDKEDLMRFLNNNLKGVSINQVLEEDFILEFENLKSKKIKLVLDPSQITLKHNQSIDHYQITPEFIRISGPTSLIHSINSRHALKVSIDTFNTQNRFTITQKLNLDSSITVSAEEVTIVLHLKKP